MLCGSQVVEVVKNVENLLISSNSPCLKSI